MPRRSMECLFINAVILGFFAVAGLSQTEPLGSGLRIETASQPDKIDQIVYDQKPYPLYPQQLDRKPDIPSPLATEDGREIVVVIANNDKYLLVPVTVENGEPYVKDMRLLFGKGNQLGTDPRDFPTLARTGLHSEIELEQALNITGISVAEITYLARPRRSSGAGFIGQDEDIISVLKGDNRLVQKMRLTHAQLAKPLFHTWNLILQEYQRGRVSGSLTRHFKYVLYNEKKVVLKALGSKGFQYSIFDDEILGNAQMDISRALTPQEEEFLHKKYAHLDERQWAELAERLSHIHTGEMVPYYVRRYGFYEGHTGYRADPIALAFIYGLKSLEEIDETFHGDLYRALTGHFTRDAVLAGGRGK